MVDFHKGFGAKNSNSPEEGRFDVVLPAWSFLNYHKLERYKWICDWIPVIIQGISLRYVVSTTPKTSNGIL